MEVKKTIRTEADETFYHTNEAILLARGISGQHNIRRDRVDKGQIGARRGASNTAWDREE